MKPVRTQQKYRCDFCKRRGVKQAMERHEPICFRNPNRFCKECNNTGKVRTHHDVGLYEDAVCVYCSKFNKEMLAQIEARERAGIPTEPLVTDGVVPF